MDSENPPEKFKIKFGPYASWDEVKAFSDLSEKAFSIFFSLVKSKGKHLLDPINHKRLLLLLRLICYN